MVWEGRAPRGAPANARWRHLGVLPPLFSAMRWTPTKEGEERIKTLFAFLPHYLPNREAYVWLETVTVLQRYDWAGFTWPRLCWKTIREVAQ